jgi:type I restriction enzyme, S subunit
MKRVALNKVAKVDRTAASAEQCQVLPYVGLEHIEKDTGHFSSEFTPLPEKLRATKYYFSQKHVLYSKLRPYLNKVVLPDFDGVCTTEIMPILPDENKLDRTFLWAYLLTPEFTDWASQIVSGANLPRLSPKDLAKHPIPLPPLEEQRRIAGILARADRLRQMRRYALQLSDGYLQAIFLRMFGDPVTNPMGWEKAKIGDVVQESQYGTSDKSNNERIGYPIFGMGNITFSGHLDLTDLSYVDLNEGEFQKLRLEQGDIIFNRTNSTELVGKTAVWNVDMVAVLASYLVKLRLTPNMLPTYFVALLNMPYYKYLFQKRCKKAVGQSNVSPTLLKEFPILIPPIDEQKRYDQVTHRMEHLRLQQREALRQADGLFDALLHRAFRGAL